MKFSIVMPCYNEAANIELILERYQQLGVPTELEVIMVNNGSTDGSAKVFSDMRSKYSFLRVVTVEKNQGYGFGILAGLREARGEYIGWTHADYQTDPLDVIRAIEKVEQLGTAARKCFIKGRRGARPWLDQFFTLGMSLFESCYFGHWLVDINAQPNLFHRDFFQSWVEPPHDFSLDLYGLIMARTQGLKLIRIPVVFHRRVHGTSSWNKGLRSRILFIKRTLNFSFVLKKRLSLGNHRSSD